MVNLKIELPEHFLEEEERCGYVIPTETKQLWAVELDLLAEFDRVCREHGITYFACGGTMLGAARHQGYIPWDDDIDLMMLRDEYDRLQKIAPSAFTEPYFWQTEETDPGSLREHAQLRRSDTTGILKSELNGHYPFNQGIFIDIFPLDAVPDDENEREAQFDKVLKLKRKYKMLANLTDLYFPTPLTEEGSGKSGMRALKMRRLAKAAAHTALMMLPHALRDPHRVWQKMDRECRRYNSRKDTKWILSIGFAAGSAGVIQQMKFREDFAEAIRLPFEFTTIPVAKGYDHALCYSFRDWHKMIHNENTHSGLIVDVERSYKTVLAKARSEAES